MKRLGLIILLTLVSLTTSATETSKDPNGVWEPFDISSEKFDKLLGYMATDGRLVVNLEFTPYRSEGVLEGCGYSYMVFLNDWAYRSNQPLLVQGSIVYTAYKDRSPFLTLKVSLLDIEKRDDKLWQRKASVNYAYLRNGVKSTAGKEDAVVDVDIDGTGFAKSFSYIDNDEELNLLTWLVLGDPLTVAFNKQPKGTDLEFDLSIRDYNNVWLALAGCFGEMAGFNK